MVVTGCCKNFLNAVAHFDYGYIECTAAQVVDHDFLIVFFIDTVGKCGSSRLIDYSLYIKTCNFACIFGSLSLSIGEVCGNCDDSLCNCFTEICFCIFFKFAEYHSGNFLRSVLFSAYVYFVGRTHLSLYRSDRVVRIGNCLTFSDLSDKSFAVLCKCNNRRSCS